MSDGDAKEADGDGEIRDVALVEVDAELNADPLFAVDTEDDGRDEAVADVHIVVETVALLLGVVWLLPHADDDSAVDSDGFALADARVDEESETNDDSVALGAVDGVEAAESEKYPVRVGVARAETVAAGLCVDAIVKETEAVLDSDESGDRVPTEGDALVDEHSVAVLVTDTLAVIELETSALLEDDVEGVVEIEGTGDPDGDTVPTVALAVIVIAGDRVTENVAEGVPDPSGLLVKRDEPDLVIVTDKVVDTVSVVSKLADDTNDADTDPLENADDVTLSAGDTEPVPLVVDDTLRDARALRVLLLVALTTFVGENLDVDVAFKVDVNFGEPVDDTDDGALCDTLGDRDALADSLALADAADDTLATDADADLLA